MGNVRQAAVRLERPLAVRLQLPGHPFLRFQLKLPLHHPSIHPGESRLLASYGGSIRQTSSTSGAREGIHGSSTQASLEVQQIPVVCSQMAPATSPSNDNLTLHLLTTLTASLSSVIAGMTPNMPVTSQNVPCFADTVWASPEDARGSHGMSGSIATPLAGPSQLVHSLDIPANVPKTCAREALPCTLSPLGYHLSPSIKDKIVRDEFVDLLSLLPSSKESLFRDKKEAKGEEDRRRPVSRGFNNWLQAYLIYSSIIREKYPEKSVGLLQHLDIVLEAYKNFGGVSWLVYDESF